MRRGANVEAAHCAVALEGKGSRPFTFRPGIVLGAAARLAVARVNVGNLADAEGEAIDIAGRSVRTCAGYWGENSTTAALLAACSGSV
ncbi:MAG TPA: hypothetical protein VGN81_08375 [Pseudonocardiaceae bacterium]